MELVHEFTFTADLKPPVSVGPGPFGDRTIFEVLSGEVTGERIRGNLGTGGADWILAGADGYGRLDVRATLHTHDGANIYVQYYGVIEYTDAGAGRRLRKALERLRRALLPHRAAPGDRGRTLRVGQSDPVRRRGSRAPGPDRGIPGPSRHVRFVESPAPPSALHTVSISPA